MCKFVQPLSLLVLLGLLVASQQLPAAEGRQAYLYRYVDDDGITVINFSIPAEFVTRGYEMLNPNGTVYKVVPRSLTAEERASRHGETLLKNKEEEEARRLAKWDKSLMLRYSSIEDIQAARDRSLGELHIRISILRSNVRSITLQVESSQSRAADVERRGGVVPVEMVAAIADLRDEIKETERSIEERVEETEVVAQGFQRDIDRFALLLDKVKLRKRYSTTPD